jgi:hypothetical protein
MAILVFLCHLFTVYETEITAVGICLADYASPFYPQKVGTNFADKRRSLAD